MSIFIIILFFVLTIILFQVTLFLFNKNDTPMKIYLAFVFSDTVLWNLCMLLIILVPWDNVKIFFYCFKYIAISTLPIFSLASVLSFLKLDTLITKKNLTALFIIPLAYIIIIFTNGYNHFFATELSIKNIIGLNMVTAAHSWAFYANSAYSYIIFFIEIFLLAACWTNVANIYKKQLSLLITAMIIPLLANSTYVFFNLSQKIFDFTPLFFSFTLIFITYGISHYNFTDIVPISRNDIFNTNITPIVVLDTHERIIDMNASAEKIFQNSLSYFCGQNISILYKYYDENVISGNDVKLSMDSKVYLNSKTYNVKHSVISNSNGLILGSYKSFYDITNEEKYLNELKYLSFHDALTNLYNRTYYNMIIDKIQSEENLPLGIVIGDLNELKTINDNLGHKVGDEAITLAAEILQNTANDNTLIFRFGGDEFCLLLPKTTEAEIIKMLENINIQFANVHKYNISISLGYSIKSNPSDNFTHLFSEADTKMYAEKNRHKLQFKNE